MNKKSKYYLIATLLTFTLCIRYPVSSHPTGVDSFLVKILAESIYDGGKIAWLLEIFSATGFYPFSEEIGVPVLLASLKLITSADLDICMWYLSVFYGFLGTLGVFTVARTIKKDTFFAVVSSFIYSSAPIFVAFTTWNLSVRGAFVGFLPIYLFLFLNAHRSFTYFFLTIAGFLALLVIHNLSVFAFYLSIVLAVWRLLVVRLNIGHILTDLRFIFPCSLLLSLPPAFRYVRSPDIDNLKNGFFDLGFNQLNIFINLLYEYSFSLGILSVAILLMIPAINNSKRFYQNNNPIPFVLLCFIPFAFDLIYIPIFLSSLFSLGIGFGISYLFNNMAFKYNFSRAKLFSLFLVLILICTSLPSLYTFRDRGDSEYNEEKYYSSRNLGIYNNLQMTESELLLSFGSAKIIGAYSNGRTIFDYNTDHIINKILSDHQILIELEVDFIEIIKGEDADFFEITDWTGGDSYWVAKRSEYYGLYEYDDSELELLMESFRVNQIVVVDESYNSGKAPIKLIDSFKDEKYVVYRDSIQSQWLVYNYL